MSEATSQPFSPEDPSNYWSHRYESGQTPWIINHVHLALEKFFDKLNPGGHPKKVLVPMCGMSVDMSWLADKGMEVIGVDISRQAVTSFVSQSGQDWTVAAAPKLGSDAQTFTRKDGKIKLYCGDVLKFTEKLEGKFDMVYDWFGLHVLNPQKRLIYGKTLKKLLNPGGRLLLEAIAYDKNLLQDENFKPPMPVPPPYSLTVEDIKAVFEPECKVEVIDKNTNTLLYGHESDFYTYFIEKM